ncbi:CRISPR-associated helicase/endonuclease Cas3 [Nocardioides hungaricus]
MQSLSSAAWSVWGKSSDYEGNSSMPLVQHLLDSAEVASLVWEWLPQHTREVIEAPLPDGARDGRRLVQWLAGAHDIGKCSPPFAAKVPSLAGRMRDEGLEPPRVSSDFSRALHGIVGQAVLTDWLCEHRGFDRRAATSAAVVVGGHHGTPPSAVNLDWLEDRPELVGTGRWREVQHEILQAISEHLGVDELLADWREVVLPPTVQALLTGAVIVSDWLASNAELFPVAEPDARHRAARAWRTLGLPPPWSPTPPTLRPDAHLSARFPTLAGLSPRPVQEMAVEAAQMTETPSLLIVEAAMGSGKTEAALLAAEILAARFGCGGVYVALPTMATSDAMFGRVLSWIENLDGHDPTSTYLAHGKHGLNEQYQGLVKQPRVTPVYDEGSPSSQVEARVLSWLTGRKKGVLANMVVGTIDQLLFAALQAKHLALRHLSLAGKVVVVDEAHAADDYMRAYLARALEWLAAYGVPVVLMSATLPRAQRQELADAYRRGLGATPDELPETAPYPALTVVSTEAPRVLKARRDTDETHHEIAVRCLDDAPDVLAAELERLLADGGCAAVIRNTVGRAQQIAEFLRSQLDGTEVVLAHSRFIATQRAQLEADLRARLGRSSGNRPARLVVVGTQVLEQSLDVDFDLMATDLAPVDLVLQRAGRLHRHVRTGRPHLLDSPQLLVTGVAEWRDGLPQFVAGSRAVYDLSLLLRSAAVLGLSADGLATLRLPEDIRPLVETAYAEDIPDAPWRQEMADADQRRTRRIADQRARADAYRIRPVDEIDDLVGWLEYGGGTEADDQRSAGASRVRDSEDGIEVIVVQRRSDGEVVFLDDGSPHAGRPVAPYQGPPKDDLARALAATTVRLPPQLTNERVVDLVLDALEHDAHAGWQQSHWLAGQLALHLDEEMRAELAGWELSYDGFLGLLAKPLTQAPL